MEDSVFLEEEKNLIDNLNRIDLLISKLNQKVETYNYELENSTDERKHNEILEKKYDKVLDINLYKEAKSCPYFGHLVLECQNKLINVFVGDKTIYLDGEFIVYDFRNPLCVLFYSKQNSFKYNGNTYRLKLKRKLIIKDGNLVSYTEETPIFENIVLENRSLNISKTLTSEQNRIMRFEKNRNVLIYGKSGTGKSSTLFYRLSCLNYNYPGTKIDNYLFITSGSHYSELRKTLGIENITILNLNEYYLECLKKLFNNKEIDKVKIKIDNKFNKEVIDNKIEKKTLKLIFDKFEEEALEDIERFKDEFKLNPKDFKSLNIYNKYLKLDNIINDCLNEELDKIKILTNNTTGWLDSIYSEMENDLSNRSNKTGLNYYRFNNTSRKDQLMTFLKDFESKVEKEITSFSNIDNNLMNEYIKLNDKLSKNINTVINTLSNNKINIVFEEYNFKNIIDSFNKYKENIITDLNKNKDELTSVEIEISNFKLKFFRNSSYNKLISRKSELEELIKDLEYKIFILLDIENKYILKFEDTYNEIIGMESKFDKNYLNLLEFKKYFLKVKEFILLIYKYEKYIDIDNLITDKMLSLINLFMERFNNKVHYFNFIYIELFNSICNDINFDNIKKFKNYLSDLKYKCSNKYLFDTFSCTSKVVYHKKLFELDNLNVYRLLFVACVTGYYKSFKSDYNFIFIDNVEDYSLMEIDLLKNTSLTACFNLTSSNLGYLKSINKIIDGKIYTLNTNLRNSLMVTKYCNNKFGYNIKESNYIGNSVKEYKFSSYKEILDLIKTYDNIVLIGEEEYLDYFKSNGVTCFSINDKLDEYTNVVVLEKEEWSNELKYNLYSRTLNDLIIYDISSIPEGINDLDII
ncbi:MAG: hypothetical protein IJ463_04980 [Bacilli bacterium]|nr:hypothetical protein [Bacilli bacterium]